MKIGMIGLGKMGANMTERLLKGGHDVVAYDLSADALKQAAGKGAETATTLAELAGKLTAPRAAWVMVPAGAPTNDTIEELAGLFSAGDVIVDGGNSNYKDSIRRAAAAASKNLRYIDAGTSGGIWGLQVGYCLMVGGEANAVKVVEPAFLDLAPKDGYMHVGPSGAGHFVKMIHNGIEYGMLQAYAEGFAILHAGSYDLDLRAISALWNHGSVVRSWLLELAERAFAADPELRSIRGYVEDSGEGRWTVQEAIDHNVPAPVITLSLLQRFRSRQEENFGDKVIAALRNQFGGHAVKPA